MTPARIVIVEDDRIVARDIAQQLSAIGHEVVGHTARGEEVWPLVAEVRPDLVLMDIRLEGEIDGIEAAQRVRAHSDVPVVFLTSYTDDATVVRAGHTSSFGYVLKPFDESQLRIVLEMALYRHEAERRLRESERRYAVTLSSIGDAVIATDAARRITFVNPVAEQLTGWPAAEAQGMPLSHVFQLADAVTGRRIALPEPATPIADLSARPELVARDGRRTPVDGHCAPIVDARGAASGVVVVVRDVTQQQQIEEAKALRVAKEGAEAANRAKDEFLANVSHELRTPLNGILGYAQILKRNAALGGAAAAGIDVIEKSGEHLLTLIDDILDFTRIEAGKLDLAPADVLLSGFLHVIADMVRMSADKKGLAFSCVVAAGVPAVVSVDEHRLRQVLLNLLTNAVKFTACGEVRLDVGLSANGLLRFEVSDSGIGIPASRLEAIFDPFEQAGERGRRFGGLGLGLAISRKLVRAMGADIAVASTVGEGSRFWFEIEAGTGRARPQPAPTPRFATGYTGNRKTVLIVDDVAANRAIIVDMLRPLGFMTVQATDAQTCLDAARTHKPDLVLMDVVLPGTSGLDVIRMLHDIPELANVPVIAVSANASAGNARDSMACGALDFIPKPLEFDVLLQKIAGALALEWTYAAECTFACESCAYTDIELPAPPQDVLLDLHRLALLGRLRDIASEAGRLARRDARYEPFANRVCLLAEQYDSQAVLALIEQYVQRASAS